MSNDDFLGATQTELAIGSQDDVFTENTNLEAVPEEEHDEEVAEPLQAPTDGVEADAVMATPDENGQPVTALFDDEEDEVASESGHDDVPQDDDFEDIEAAELEDYPEDQNVVRIPLAAAKGTPAADDKLILIGLPLRTAVDYAEFDYAQVAAEERRLLGAHDSQSLSSMKQALLGKDTIRYKTTETGETKTTFKYVEFSDGSSAIVSENHVYTQLGGCEYNASLLDVAQLPVMRVHGELPERRMYAKVQSGHPLKLG